MTLFMKNNGRILVLAMSVIGIMLFMYACSKDGETIYEFNPDEPQAVKAPIVTVIYSAKALGDRQSNDLIYKGVERPCNMALMSGSFRRKVMMRGWLIFAPCSTM